ncbi:MAG: hypothetical protein WBC18_27905 [Ottowia sp.]|uniref:hypothetical protein n=1 Tax=unclassified Ottowia TaxID=2645081 RepID=UPI003C2B2B5B
MHLSAVILALSCLTLAGAARAQVPELFKGADLKLGEKLISENKCNECHARDWTDNGKAVYRPKGRINTPTALQGMVERCSHELNLSFFPEEIAAISAVLNRDHYRFSK